MGRTRPAEVEAVEVHWMMAWAGAEVDLKKTVAAAEEEEEDHPSLGSEVVVEVAHPQTRMAEAEEGAALIRRAVAAQLGCWKGVMAVGLRGVMAGVVEGQVQHFPDLVSLVVMKAEPRCLAAGWEAEVGLNHD